MVFAHMNDVEITGGLVAADLEQLSCADFACEAAAERVNFRCRGNGAKGSAIRLADIYV